MSKWIKVSERLPNEDDCIVLTFFKGGTFSLATCSDGEWSHSLDNPDVTPTHWQHLPKDPAEQNQTGDAVWLLVAEEASLPFATVALTKETAEWMRSKGCQLARYAKDPTDAEE